jgi:hypothetical protein
LCQATLVLDGPGLVSSNWPGQSSAPFQVATLQLQTMLDLSSGDMLVAAPTSLIWVNGQFALRVLRRSLRLPLLSLRRAAHDRCLRGILLQALFCWAWTARSG